MSAVSRLVEAFGSGSRPAAIRVLCASGQLGYGIPRASFAAGLERDPHLIGCDMGSIDIGPYFLGSGKIATPPASTRRDLALVIRAARQNNAPLVIASAGSAGAHPHLERTLELVREIAREDGLHFRMGVLRADIAKSDVKAAIRQNRIAPLDGMAPLTEDAIESTTHIVGQMGTGAVRRALEADVDVVIAGRACDTAIFAALPIMLGFPEGAALHMAKIVECSSLCCVPGGRDPMLGTLDHEGFVIESMAPQRRATPVSVAAHSLYEQNDPNTVMEPDGRLDLSTARYAAVDDRRTRVAGATWHPSRTASIKLEGATFVGERAVLLAGAADPRFIRDHRAILAQVESLLQDVAGSGGEQDFRMIWRIYGIDGVRSESGQNSNAALPSEVFILGECIAPTAERALEVIGTAKQLLLHHGYPGRLSTGGNLAFPFTPPEVATGPAYRFSVYHVMQVDDPNGMFPLDIEEL